MNPGVLSVLQKRIAFFVMALLVLGGVVAYQRMGRLEDPEFTIKEALIVTAYPGASAEEVAKEVSNPIESACQQLGQLKRVESESTRGRSVVSAIIKDRFHADRIPQVWDELRRKINDVQSRLPPSVRGTSMVIDDFGDVYGIFLTITGKDFSYPELRRYAEFLRRELQTVRDVKKVDLFAEQQEVVFLEISRQRLAQLGINEEQIYAQLQAKNIVADGGRVRVGAEYPALDPTGGFQSAEDMLNLAIGSDRTGRQLFLRDIATLVRAEEDPPRRLLKFDGKSAIGLGISVVGGGNVVTMGEGVRRKLAELKRNQPIGIEIGEINFQPEAVTEATRAFAFNLVKAVSIVFVVLLIMMGLRAGTIIGLVLLLTILGTLQLMYFNGVLMERISLGAFIIALCMLTDNAIVVNEAIKVGIESGRDKLEVIREAVAQNQWPLFGATAIAVIAFAAIGLSEDSTGEVLQLPVLGDFLLADAELVGGDHVHTAAGLRNVQAGRRRWRGRQGDRRLREPSVPNLSRPLGNGAAVSLDGRTPLDWSDHRRGLRISHGHPELFPARHPASVPGRRLSTGGHPYSRIGSICGYGSAIHPEAARGYSCLLVHRQRRPALSARLHPGKREPGLRGVPDQRGRRGEDRRTAGGGAEISGH